MARRIFTSISSTRSKAHSSPSSSASAPDAKASATASGLYLSTKVPDAVTSAASSPESLHTTSSAVSEIWRTMRRESQSKKHTLPSMRAPSSGPPKRRSAAPSSLTVSLSLNCLNVLSVYAFSRMANVPGSLPHTKAMAWPKHLERQPRALLTMYSSSSMSTATYWPLGPCRIFLGMPSHEPTSFAGSWMSSPSATSLSTLFLTSRRTISFVCAKKILPLASIDMTGSSLPTLRTSRPRSKASATLLHLGFTEMHHARPMS
mmetsp:Transcript_26464/g.81779  ORF Transcript_26464/g.81779 Transcript_26464/m.81779 type:complete len:261 (-) Transcript_26464:848-1630(-)